MYVAETQMYVVTGINGLPVSVSGKDVPTRKSIPTIKAYLCIFLCKNHHDRSKMLCCVNI